MPCWKLVREKQVRWCSGHLGQPLALVDVAQHGAHLLQLDGPGVVPVIHPAHRHEAVLYCTVLYCTVLVVLELSDTRLNIQRSFSSLVPLTAMFTATMNSCSHSLHFRANVKKQVQTLKSIPPLLSSSIIRKSWSTRNLLSLSGLIFFS